MAEPITVALIDDYDVVVQGVANMLEPYRDRIVVAELDGTLRDLSWIPQTDAEVTPVAAEPATA